MPETGRAQPMESAVLVPVQSAESVAGTFRASLDPAAARASLPT